MGQLSFEGILVAGPASQAAGVFPGSSVNCPVSLKNNNSSYGACTGVLERSLSSASSYTTLDGVGAGKTVTRGTFLYLKTDSKLSVRLTYGDDGDYTTTPIVIVIVVQGLFVMEFASGAELVLLEAEGTSKIEYWVSGQQ
jgi:hypothetical protein